MQHTLPLKEKQIEQTRLEAEARKESTVKNAEAAAQAKVIDSRAELERGKLMAEAEANRIRVLAAADAERMKIEAAVLKDSPLLIQKIIAERLSDKVQIMMVPMDGKFFFANDVLRGLGSMTSPQPRTGAGPQGQESAARRAATRRCLTGNGLAFGCRGRRIRLRWFVLLMSWPPGFSPRRRRAQPGQPRLRARPRTSRSTSTLRFESKTHPGRHGADAGLPGVEASRPSWTSTRAT